MSEKRVTKNKWVRDKFTERSTEEEIERKRKRKEKEEEPSKKKMLHLLFSQKLKYNFKTWKVKKDDWVTSEL